MNSKRNSKKLRHVIEQGFMMRTPYTQLYVHYVWATWDRMPLITPVVEGPLYASIQSKCRELKCLVVAIGGTSDHIHLLVRFPTTLTIADFAKEVKGASSHVITHEVAPAELFKWQGAYGAFTVSKSLVQDLAAYIENQKKHHKENHLYPEWEHTFKTE